MQLLLLEVAQKYMDVTECDTLPPTKGGADAVYSLRPSLQKYIRHFQACKLLPD